MKVNGISLLTRKALVTQRFGSEAWHGLFRDVALRHPCFRRPITASGMIPLPEFLDVMTGDYGAPLALVDFAGNTEAARSTINDWVSEVTEEKISELFPSGSIDSTTVLALTNAMYMDAPWKYTFDLPSNVPRARHVLSAPPRNV